MIWKIMFFCMFVWTMEWGSLVGTKEQRSEFNNFGSRKAFSIILFVAFREFFVAAGVKFLKLFFWILPPIVLHLLHCFGCWIFMTWGFIFFKLLYFFIFYSKNFKKDLKLQVIKKNFIQGFFRLDSKNKTLGYKNPTSETVF